MTWTEPTSSDCNVFEYTYSETLHFSSLFASFRRFCIVFVLFLLHFSHLLSLFKNIQSKTFIVFLIRCSKAWTHKTRLPHQCYYYSKIDYYMDVCVAIGHVFFFSLLLFGRFLYWYWSYISILQQWIHKNMDFVLVTRLWHSVLQTSVSSLIIFFFFFFKIY